MSGTEEVDGTVGVEAHLGRDDNIHQFRIAVLLHQGDHAADGVHIDVHLGHLLGAVLPEVRVDRSLDDAVDHHIPFEGDCLLGPLEGLYDGFRGLFLRPERLGKDVEHGTDVGTDSLLELHNLLVGHFNLAVHVALEGTGVGHDDAGEIQHLMQALGPGLLVEGGSVLDDV